MHFANALSRCYLLNVCGIFFGHVFFLGVSVAVTYRDKPLLYFSAGVKDVDSNQPVSPQTLFQCGSVSKSFTSALAHIAIEVRGAWRGCTNLLSICHLLLS
jgi:hypothetical protein